jgi:hypothetical protein
MHEETIVAPGLRKVIDLVTVLVGELPVEDVEVPSHSHLIEALGDHTITHLINPPNANLQLAKNYIYIYIYTYPRDCRMSLVRACKRYPGDGFAPVLGYLFENRGVHDRTVSPWCVLAAQRRVGAKLDPILPTKLPQLSLPAIWVHLHLHSQWKYATQAYGRINMQLNNICTSTCTPIDLVQL